MKKKYMCNWLLCNITKRTMPLKVVSHDTIYGTNKKVLENQVRYMLKQKYKTKEFRDNYECHLLFFIKYGKFESHKIIKSI